jgi:hypothetical protein
MTQIADRLEKARLVMREAEAGDRRVRRLNLTARAAKMMQKRRDARVQRMIEVLEHIEPASREKLLAGMDALLQACGKAHGSEIVDIQPDQVKPDYMSSNAKSSAHSDQGSHHR